MIKNKIFKKTYYMKSSPLVSVLMPVYNCDQYILESIESVLNQTFSDFELLIIDDCSTDNTFNIIQAIEDERIKLFQKPKNSGYTDSLNYGISIAKGKYVARMDGDDICLPTRFEKQVNFLDKNPEVILCGTAIQIIGTEKVLRHPLNHDEIKVKLCFANSLYHPTLMGRIEVFKEHNYDKKYEPAEDYELWTRLVFLGKLANLEEVLLKYRIHENQISEYKKSIQISNFFKCRINMLNQLNLLDSFSEKDILIAIEEQNKYDSINLTNSLKIFKLLKKENKNYKRFKEDLFSQYIDKIRLDFIKRYLRSGSKIKTSFFLLTKISIFDYLKALNLNKSKMFNSMFFSK